MRVIFWNYRETIIFFSLFMWLVLEHEGHLIFLLLDTALPFNLVMMGLPQ
jgi:hypothetical protein